MRFSYCIKFEIENWNDLHKKKWWKFAHKWHVLNGGPRRINNDDDTLLCGDLPMMKATILHKKQKKKKNSNQSKRNKGENKSRRQFYLKPNTVA